VLPIAPPRTRGTSLLYWRRWWDSNPDALRKTPNLLILIAYQTASTAQTAGVGYKKGTRQLRIFRARRRSCRFGCVNSMKPRSPKKNKSADKLTAREIAFLIHLEAGTTITNAARLAGYSTKWPGQAGSQAFRNIQRKRPEILHELGWTVEAIIRSLKASGRI